MITIDGSTGEGGGQILRTSLGLSMYTGKPFRIYNIRARRKKPGLLRQHLTCALAAKEICGAEAKGAAMGSSDLTFLPGTVQPGEYRFAVGTAGSASLVLQAVLPALLTASGDTRLTLEGGTHNRQAPPFDFIDRSFLPILRSMGPGVRAQIERYGFFPVGGGRYTVAVRPAPHLRELDLNERGKLKRHTAVGIVSKIRTEIAADEAKTIARRLALKKCMEKVMDVDSPGPGNAAMLISEFENVTEVFTGFGERGMPRRDVAAQVIREAKGYLKAEGAVGPHLADQLLIPLAMAGKGSFTTTKPTEHTRTNIETIQRFIHVDLRCEEIGEGVWKSRVR